MAPVIGLDVGGANTKAAVVDGDDAVRTVSEPFEVWREPDGLPGVIADVVGRLGLDDAPVALTTTAELVDVFASKREGVLHVLDAARQALPGRRLRVMTTAGELVSLERGARRAAACAAANWVATALLVARSLPDAILVDCGGTTTDVIPIAAGEVAARGRTDLERLLAGELVYTGALRTNVAAVVSHVPIGGRPCPVSSELFAIAADAHLLRGALTPEQCTCTFPDDRGAAPGEVRARLARVVCADPEQLADGDLEAIAGRRRGGAGSRDRGGPSRASPRTLPPAPRWSPSASARSSPARRPSAAASRSTRTRPCSPLPGRAERSPPRSRCRCSAVSELRRCWSSRSAAGSCATQGLEGLRRACAEVNALAQPPPVLVVPGGGPFADAVRAVDAQVGLGDDVAHALALRAMDQLGLLLARLLPAAEPLTALVAPRALGLLVAAPAFAGRPEVPESWAVTSDSLAVLAAGAIGAEEAILLKPVAGVLARWPSEDPPLPELTAGRAAGAAGRRGRAGRRPLPARGRAPHRRGRCRSGAPDAISPAGTRIVPD